MKNRPLCSICLFLFVLMCIGIFTGKEKVIHELRPSPVETYVEEGEAITFTGRLYQREIKDKYQILYLKDNSVEYQGQSLHESKMIVYDEKKIDIHIGEKIRGYGKAAFFEPAYNPGNFNQKLYYQKQDIHVSVWTDKLEITDVSVDRFREGLYRFQTRWKEALVRYMGEKNGNVLAAMILGEKGSMDTDLKELYQKNGIGHVLAISGIHLSFIGIGIYKFLRKFTGSYPIGGIFGILFLMLYILMIGLTVSAVRALIMFLFRAGADMAGRHYDAPTALSVAAVVVLLWRPLSLYDGGFWLSFGAVLAILVMAPVVQRGSNSKRWQGLSQGLMAGIGMNLMLLPILLYYFFEFPFYSFLLNLFVIPLMSVLLFLGIAGSLFSLCFSPLAGICFWICGGILRLYKTSCQLALYLPGARFVAGRPEIWQILVYYGILSIVLLCLRKRGRRIEVALILGIAGIMILTNHWGERGTLTTVALDVGQGDGIFMRGPKGGTYLVDGGSSDVNKVGRYRIEPFLKSQGVGALDYVLISHGDSDHINGVEELIERQDMGVKIGTLVLPVPEVWDEELTGLAEKAKGYGIRVVVIKPGQSIKEGDMAITCIQPGNMGTESGNASSMVLAVQYEEFDMLLTGDVEGEGEEQLTEKLEEQYRDCSWEILKVAHHGSKNSSSEEFLRQVSPVYALISAGRENRYGHPHQETIERLADAGSKICSTQENGALIMEVKGGTFMFLQ